MKFFIYFFVVLFSFHLEFVLLDKTSNEKIKNIISTKSFLQMEKTFDFTTPQNDYLSNISIQDVSSSDMNSSEKIEREIIDIVTQYATNCHIYRKIDLSIEGFTFPESSITIYLGSENVTFRNIRISESSQSLSKRKLYSTLFGCDSARMTKIQVKLPKDLEFYADLAVTQIPNSSNGFTSTPEILNTGFISFTLKHNVISKQYSNQQDNAHSIMSKIFYSKSTVTLDIDTKFQMPIYNKLQTFFDEVESPVRQFLLEKLNVEFNCSKFINDDKNLKKINSPLFNSNLNHLYVIPSKKLEIWKGLSLSVGPTVIDGLSSFNSMEFIISGNEVSSSSSNGYFRTTPSYDDPEVKETTIKIKMNDLKGKLDWSYDSKQRSISFTVDFIQFEVKKSNTFQYITENGYYEYEGYGYYGNYYEKADNNKIHTNVYLGNIQIKSSKSSICENESEFVNYVLVEYLKTEIVDFLKNSLDQKVQNESLFFNCD